MPQSPPIAIVLGTEFASSRRQVGENVCRERQTTTTTIVAVLALAFVAECVNDGCVGTNVCFGRQYGNRGVVNVILFQKQIEFLFENLSNLADFPGSARLSSQRRIQVKQHIVRGAVLFGRKGTIGVGVVAVHLHVVDKLERTILLLLLLLHVSRRCRRGNESNHRQ